MLTIYFTFYCSDQYCWGGPTDKVFDTNIDCKKLENVRKDSLTIDECKDECIRYQSIHGEICNAVNYRRKKESCVLKRCPFPVPAPTKSQTKSDILNEFEGYYLLGNFVFFSYLGNRKFSNVSNIL